MMERLTEWDEYRNADIIGVCLGTLQCNLHVDELRLVIDALNRLAAYEDSGLTPERAQELGKADADGRVVVLPCKVGDTVYFIKSNFSFALKPIPLSVESFRIFRKHFLMFGAISEGGVERRLSVSDFGKTVFLDSAEAEAALEKMKGE